MIWQLPPHTHHRIYVPQFIEHICALFLKCFSYENMNIHRIKNILDKWVSLCRCKTYCWESTLSLWGMTGINSSVISIIFKHSLSFPMTNKQNYGSNVTWWVLSMERLYFKTWFHFRQCVVCYSCSFYFSCTKQECDFDTSLVSASTAGDSFSR